MTGVLAPHFRTPLIIRWHRTYGPPSPIKKCATKPWTRTGVCENHSTSGWAMLPSLEFSLFWICQWCQAGIFLSNRQTGNQQRSTRKDGPAAGLTHFRCIQSPRYSPTQREPHLGEKSRVFICVKKKTPTVVEEYIYNLLYAKYTFFFCKLVCV